MEQEQLVAMLQTALQALADAQRLHLQLAAAHAQAPTPAAAAPAPLPAADHLLSEWIEIHLQQLQAQGLKAQTIRNRRSLLAHVRRLWGTQPIRSLKPHQVAAGIRSFPPSRASTAARVLRELRDVYAEAVAYGWAEHNPAELLKSPRTKVQRARLTFEVWQQMRVLASASPQRWVESMLLLALLTGQRRADLAKARFDDIVQAEDGQRYLRIEQQKKAGKDFGARIELPLALRLDAVGMSLADVIEHCRASAKPGPTLLRKAGGGGIEESSLSNRFHELIVTVLGDGAHERHRWPSLHEVRSLAARMYRQQGVDTQTLLGHKNAEMTAVYEDDRGLSADQWKRLQVSSA